VNPNPQAELLIAGRFALTFSFMAEALASALALALQLESELDEERRRGREVVDHDAHVLHALDRHALDCSDTTAPSYSVSRLPIGWWERAAHWSEETSDELLGSIGS
jgi:hypothetical protein